MSSIHYENYNFESGIWTDPCTGETPWMDGFFTKHRHRKKDLARKSAVRLARATGLIGAYRCRTAGSELHLVDSTGTDIDQEILTTLK